MQPWYSIHNENEIATPAILLYPERIRHNIDLMIRIAGGVERLRPHVKTHKLPEVIRMQLDAGITRFKCATLSEADMVAAVGAKDILVAFPQYEPGIRQLLGLCKKYPSTRFSMLVDNLPQVQLAEELAAEAGIALGIFLDLDVGMERTGIQPGPDAIALYQHLEQSTRLDLRGLHIYDGHLHQSDADERQKACDTYFQELKKMTDQLADQGVYSKEWVCGGTPTFPIHAKDPERILSPGTVLLWDWRYSNSYIDLPFLHAAVLLTRVVSKPGKGKLCLDLGHKALGSEMPAPRVHLFGIPDYEMTTHSEEHMVIQCDNADQFNVGDCIYGIPIHICPTMALHDFAWVVNEGKAAEQWHVKARTRAVEI